MINAGTFKNNENYRWKFPGYGTLNVWNSFTDTSAISVYGGTFSSDPANGDDSLGGSFVAAGRYSVAGADVWNVTDGTGLGAVVGDRGYATLADAVAAAKDGDTIKLLAAQAADGITTDKEVTLDLNGQTLTLNDTKTLTLGAATTIVNGDLTQGGLTIDGQVIVNGSLDFSTLKWGTGGLATGSATGALKVGGSVTFWAGNDPRYMQQLNPNFFAGSTAGATFVSGSATYTYGNGVWAEGTSQAVAKIGTYGYGTLAAALAAAQDTDTVTLLADIETAVAQQWTISKDVTLDFNGKTITKTVSNDWVFRIAKDADVTFAGMAGGITFNPVAAGNLGNPASMIQILGKLTVDGGVYQSDFTIFKVDEDDFETHTAKGELVVNDGTFTIVAAPAGYTGKQWAVMNWATATINGGTWTGVIGTRSADGNTVSKFGTTTINGGTGATYLLFVGDKNDTTCSNFPMIKGVEQSAVALEKVATITDTYKLTTSGEYITVKAIDYATLTIADVENCSIVVSNATAEVASGATFDKDDATELTVYRTPAAHYVLKDCAATEVITMDKDQTVTAEVEAMLKYYAEVYVDGEKQGWGTSLGTNGGYYAKGVTVPVKEDGVRTLVAGKTHFVSKLVLNGDPEKVWLFSYDGTKLTQTNATEGVTISENIKLAYDVVTGDLACFAKVYFSEYVDGIKVTATFSVDEDLTGVNYSIDGATAVAYTSGTEVKAKTSVQFFPQLASWRKAQYDGKDGDGIYTDDATVVITAVEVPSGDVTDPTKSVEEAAAAAGVTTTVVDNLAPAGATDTEKKESLNKAMTWAKANDKTTTDVANLNFTTPDQTTEAYLLNTADTEEAVKEAKEDFAATITIDASGNPVVKITDEAKSSGDAYGNGHLEQWGATTLGSGADWAKDKSGAKFFKYRLVK